MVEGYAEKMLREIAGKIFQGVAEDKMKPKMEQILRDFANF
jgi:hypothetical protein